MIEGKILNTKIQFQNTESNADAKQRNNIITTSEHKMAILCKYPTD